MKLHYALPTDGAYRAERERHPLCVAIGVFDGFHLGHQAILRTLLQARRAGERTAVMTFAKHPATLLRPDDVPPQTFEIVVHAAAKPQRFDMTACSTTLDYSCAAAQP